MLFWSFELSLKISKVSNKTQILWPIEGSFQVFRLIICFWNMSEVVCEKNGLLLLFNVIFFTFWGKFWLNVHQLQIRILLLDLFWVFALVTVIETWFINNIMRKNFFDKFKYFLQIFEFSTNIFFQPSLWKLILLSVLMLESWCMRNPVDSHNTIMSLYNSSWWDHRNIKSWSECYITILEISLCMYFEIFSLENYCICS